MTFIQSAVGILAIAIALTGLPLPTSFGQSPATEKKSDNSDSPNAEAADKTDATEGTAEDESEKAPAPAQPEETPEEERERISAERFLEVLKKRPRLGTALDRVYGYHVGNGTLPDFVQSLNEEAKENSDGNLWMVLGMVQMQRGQDSLAADALAKAEELLPEQPLASYYLGKSLVLLGEVDKATDALRRAVKRKPPRADALAIFKDLGRIYQRTGRNEEALSVWEDLETMFPRDDQVKEEIATILAEEGAEQAALDRYTALSETLKDRFRKTEMTIRAAQLKAQLGKKDEALADFEKQLELTNPDSWLHRDVRRRIEEVFWTSGDVDGLVKYYEKRTTDHPDDVHAMMRAARVLAIQRRMPEAEKWFRKAIEKAPSQTDPRQALVDALVTDGRYELAAKEMEELAKVEPDNPDYIVRWGELVLGDTSRDEAKRKEEAQTIWMKMLEKRGDDPVTVSRVADLLRSASASDAAIEHYRKAIELAPSEPQYREYLGEYLHQLKRTDEAVKVWRELASGDRKTLENLVRLSEVLSTFKYKDEALATMATACEMNPGFGERARYAELLRESEKYTEALEQLDLAEPLADEPELRDLVIDERIKNYQSSGELEKRIEQAEAATAGDQSDAPDAWRMLALLRDADRKFQLACDAIEKSTGLAPNEAAYWNTAARIQERAGRMGDAIKSYRKLATIDRRFRSNYLMQIATLEMRVGNIDKALAAGEDLLASAAGNSDHYRFYADLCFQVGKGKQGLDALRRNIRRNPNDNEALQYLARQLANEFETAEAIELYWKAFDSEKDLEARTAVIGQLAELYLRTNRFQTLVDRLELMGREQNKPRDGLLWVSAAHQAAGDLGKARELLEQLARQDSRDTRLLGQLVSLAQSEYDYETAAEYQKRLVVASPTPQNEYALAKLLLELGEVDKAKVMWQRLAQRKDNSKALSSSISALISKEEYEVAITLIERALSEEPDNWEIVPAAVTCYYHLDRHEDSMRLAERVLSMNVEMGTPTAKTKEAIAKRAARPQQNTPAGYDPYANLSNPGRMLNAAQQLQRTVGADGRNYSISSRTRAYTPTCFQDAYAFALCVPLLSNDKDFDLSKFIDEKVDAAVKSDDTQKLWEGIVYATWANPQARYDNQKDSQYEKCLDRLVELEDAAAATMKISKLVNASRSNSQSTQKLTEENKQELLRLSELVAKDSQPQVQNYMRVWIAAELARSGDEDKASEIVDEYLKSNRGANAGTYFLQTGGQMLAASTGSEPTEWMVEKGTVLVNEGLQAMDNKTFAQNGQGRTFAAITHQLAIYGTPEQATGFVQAMLRKQAEHTAGLRPSQRGRSSSSQARPTSYYISSATRGYTQRQVAFPNPSGHFSEGPICGLHALYEESKSDEKKLAAIRKSLDEWAADKSVVDPYLRLAYLMAKTSFAYWSDDKKGAIATLQLASELPVEGQFIRLAQAQLLFDSGLAKQALEVVESLRPTNQQMLVDRELAILQLVLELGDLERAKKSAKKLFALRLKSDVEFQLSEVMTGLGMKEMGDLMMGRIRRRAGGKKETLVKLMNSYANAKDNKAAGEIARQIVRRTSPSASRNMRTADSVQHEQALRLLARIGELEPLIERYEKLVESSPKSSKLKNKLAAIYKAAGRREESSKLLMKSAELAPNKPQNLMAAAKQFAQLGEHRKAVDKFIEAIAKSPSQLDQNYWELDDSFRHEDGWERLTDGIIKIGIKKFSSNHNLSNIVSNMVHRSGANTSTNAAINRLLVAGLKELPMAQVSQLMYSFSNKSFEPTKEVAQLLGNKLVEEKGSLTSNSGMSMYSSSRGSHGHAYGAVNGIAKIIASDEKMTSAVAKAMQARLEKPDAEVFPRVLLTLIHFENKEFDDAAKVAKPILDKKKKNAQDGQAIWCLGSALIHDASKYQMGTEFLSSVNDPKIVTNDYGQFEYSFEALKAYGYEKAKDFSAARKILVDTLNKAAIDPQHLINNPGYGEYQYIESLRGLSQRFLEMGYPGEAFIAFRKAYSDEEMLEKTQQWGGNVKRQMEQLKKQMQASSTAEKILPVIAAALSAGKDQQKPDSAGEENAEEDAEEDTTEDRKSADDQKPEDDPNPTPGETGLETARFLTKPEISEKSLIDVQISMPLEEFTTSFADNEKLRNEISDWLSEHPLEKDAVTVPLKSLIARMIVCKAVENEEQTRQTADAIAKVIEDFEISLPATKQEEPEDGASDTEVPEQSSDGQLLPEATEEALLFAAAVMRLPDSDDGQTIPLLERAIEVAKQSGNQSLVRGLQCQIATRAAVDDADLARKLFLQALDDVLPKEKSEDGEEKVTDKKAGVQP